MLHCKCLEHSFQVALEHLGQSVDAHNPDRALDEGLQWLIVDVERHDETTVEVIRDTQNASKHQGRGVEKFEVTLSSLDVASTNLLPDQSAGGLIQSKSHSSHHAADVYNHNHARQLLLAQDTCDDDHELGSPPVRAG